MEIRMHHPKHGFHVVYDNAEKAAHERHGWSVVEEKKPEISLAEQYEAKFGKKPHHLMKPENIQKAIDDNG